MVLKTPITRVDGVDGMGSADRSRCSGACGGDLGQYSVVSVGVLCGIELPCLFQPSDGIDYGLLSLHVEGA